MKIHICGNCQSEQMALGLQVMLSPGHVVTAQRYSSQRWHNPDHPDVQAAQHADVAITNLSTKRYEECLPAYKILRVPDYFFNGFHPDQTLLEIAGTHGRVAVTRDGGGEHGTRTWFPVLGLCAWGLGLSPDIAATLYRDDVFEALGYFDAYPRAVADHVTKGEMLGVNMAHFSEFSSVPSLFMWGVEHPKLPAVFALCGAIADKLGLRVAVPAVEAAGSVMDPLEREYSLPCYPPLASRLGITGSWVARVGLTVHQNLKTYLSECWHLFGHYPKDSLAVLGKPGEIQRVTEVIGRFL